MVSLFLILNVIAGVACPNGKGRSSGAGTVECKKPQSKHTNSFGNNQTPGLSQILEPNEMNKHLSGKLGLLLATQQT